MKRFGIQAYVPIVSIYFEKDKIYIYTVDEGNVVKRLLLTPDGENRNYEIIFQTEDVCVFLV